MKKVYCIYILSLLCSFTFVKSTWLQKNNEDYTLFYTSNDSENLKEYESFLKNGINVVHDFFQEPFNTNFDIYIHPNRASLDSTWQKDWGMSNFKSQCWMVASGVASKLDIISPKRWDSLACEHVYANITKTQRLITHELVHVFHGQKNKSPDFRNVTGIDWFVEGLATYVSGQCDADRIAKVKNAVLENKAPTSLNNFWKGNLKYGLSGTMVMYLNEKYGHDILVHLLEYNDVKEVFMLLNTTELEILQGWKDYIINF
ncbi:peptidase MA family metallohydrolase [Yeosuana marina]|uniref:peptidase MA family metallohydrolase n=1 Tax=Yeosuana marina TaxID=1565536 RepID=UPI0030EDCC10|tara:strand:- start:647 stop:1423 length:777 start_codon:yes stop_codon:yes gene_type:complete